MSETGYEGRSATPWIAEPMTLEETKLELRLVLDELAHKGVERRVLAEQILELESDRSYLLARIEYLVEQRLEDLEQAE